MVLPLLPFYSVTHVPGLYRRVGKPAAAADARRRHVRVDLTAPNGAARGFAAGREPPRRYWEVE
jgi:hypothetical protein